MSKKEHTFCWMVELSNLAKALLHGLRNTQLTLGICGR